MDDGVEDDGDHGSQHTSDDSSDSEDMDDEEDVEEEGESDGNSIIDMLEEQQMDADQGDGADGWTTDTDSVDEGEEIDEDEDEDEFGGFPPPPIPVLDEDEMDYSDDEMDESLEEVREIMGGLEDQIFDPMLDEEDEEDDHMHHHHDEWLFRGRDFPGNQFFPPHVRGSGLFADNRARTAARRSGAFSSDSKLTMYSFPPAGSNNHQPTSYDGECSVAASAEPCTRYCPTYPPTRRGASRSLAKHEPIIRHATYAH